MRSGQKYKLITDKLTKMNITDLYKIFKNSKGVTTDSRTVKEGEIFFALKGENFDGNQYAKKALDSGASHAVVTKGSEAAKLAAGDNRYIPVENTLITLQELARWHRSMMFVDGKPLTVIGLTGTNGKTTTKELIRCVLSVKYNVTATEGNLNNSIGVPLSLLKINSETQIAVIEMGASHPGDIKELVSVCLPNYGLVTNVGKGHLLGFGSLEGVMKTKGELYDYIQRTADKAFVNVDNPLLTKMAAERPDLLTIPYGTEYCGAEILESTAEQPFLRMLLTDESGEKITLNTNLVGSYNADNVIAAIAVGKEFGISLSEAIGAISKYNPTNNRSQLTRTENNLLIIDAYNANPTSMEAALSNFENTVADRKAVMLGDMLELGQESVQEHIKILDRLKSMTLTESFIVGEEFRKAAEIEEGRDSAHLDRYGNIRWFASSETLSHYLEENPLKETTILIKGSRGVKMEKIVPSL